MTKKEILIIGHGEMGQAFEFLLGSDKVDVWQRHGATQSLAETAADRNVIFFCVPANPVYDISLQIKSQLKQDTICLSIAKGLDGSGRPAAMAMRDGLGNSCVQGVIYGPMISEELRAGRPGFGNLALSDKKALPVVEALFSTSVLRLQQNDDLTGITWCAILKNVYALAFGMADELGLGDNMRGYLSVTAMHELSKISVKFGGNPESPYSLAGLGDLITTATSEDSHHHSLGRQLARNDRSNLTGEGVHTLQMVRDKELLPIQNYPLFSAVNQIVLGKETAAIALGKLTAI